MRILFLLLLCLLPATAQAASPHIRATLISETATPAAGGQVALAIAFVPAPGWHGYWKNPGDSGVETRVDWSLPAGMSVTPLRFPVPERLTVAGLMNYVYGGPHALLTSLHIPASLHPGTSLPLRAKVDWLECTDEICVPASAVLRLNLVVGDGSIVPADRQRFDGYRAALPRPLGSMARFEQSAGRLRVAIPLPASVALADPYMFPLTEGAISHAAPQSISRNGNMLIVEVATPANANPLRRLEGVLRSDGKPPIGLAFTAAPGKVPPAGTRISGGAEGQDGPGIALLALGGAMIGGLLLNVMPCVFPILSLKALSLLRAGESEAAARREALAYAAGVILVCLILGAILLVLRAGGNAAGWAFQLQDPRIILLLLLLTTAIGLNLAGLFELGVLSMGDGLVRAGGARGAFWTGALAAFIATPCTGPFMAAALGAALVLPPPAAMLVFAGLGIGLASPFLLLGFVPGLRRKLPRPGPWMVRFRKIMAVPMLLTALGLAWVLGRQAGVDGMTLGLAATLVVALALWWVGHRQAHLLNHAWLPLAPALAAAGAAMAAVTSAPATSIANTGAVLPFDETRLARLTASGKPVFLYFTADWCLTCKVNERAAIDRAEVKAAFSRAGITVMAGDWTRGDAAIGRFLEAHGRSGVPLYLFYRSGRPVEVLPQILTPGLLAALAG